MNNSKASGALVPDPLKILEIVDKDIFEFSKACNNSDFTHILPCRTNNFLTNRLLA